MFKPKKKPRVIWVLEWSDTKRLGCFVWDNMKDCIEGREHKGKPVKFVEVEDGK